jgi:hypothetical protein
MLPYGKAFWQLNLNSLISFYSDANTKMVIISWILEWISGNEFDNKTI